MSHSRDLGSRDTQPALTTQREECPSEALLHAEHQAALEGTLFLKAERGEELVFELRDGQLRLADPNR